MFNSRMRGPKYDVENELEDLKVAIELNDCKVQKVYYARSSLMQR